MFRVDPTKVPMGGVRARCSVCGGVMTVPDRDDAVATQVRTPTPRGATAAAPRESDSEMEAAPEPTGEAFTEPAPGRVVTPGAGLRRPFAPGPTIVPPATAAARPATPSGTIRAPFNPLARPAAPVPRPVTPATPVVGPVRTPLVAPVVTPVVAPVAAIVAPVAPVVTPTTPVAETPDRGIEPLRPTLRPTIATSVVSDRPARRPINPFLANDPGLKAKRLARALVSDMVAYLPQKREEGLRNNTLKALFREEIKKSYEEYVDQIGREVAESTTHFQDALNDVLSGGRKLF